MVLSEFQKIRHFTNRMGFGLNPYEYFSFQERSLRDVVNGSFNQSVKNLEYVNQDPPPTMQPQSREAFQKQQQKNIKATGKVRSEWIHRMMNGSDALVERVSLFWHGHFACRIIHPGLATQYLNVLRTFGLGSFKDLVLAIAKNPAMIRYLNNQQNRKGNPNENFTRELLELFTLGRGNYSEQDIKQGARAFTGWSSNRKGEFVFRRFFHDEGKKTFLGQEGYLDGEDIIDIILARNECAYFLAKSMLEYFVGKEVASSHIDLVASVLMSNGLHIGDTLKYMALSNWFYDQRYIGNKIKSPVDLIAGACRQSGIDSINSTALQFLLRSLGQALFNPPNVAGWPGGKQWIDNATLTLRLNLPALLLKNIRHKKLNLETEPRLEYFEHYVLDDRKDPVESLGDFLLGTSAWESNTFLINMIEQVSNNDQTLENLIILLMSTPEYQMC